MIYAGLFVNIVYGNFLIIVDEIVICLVDYIVIEGGFGFDMGFEKVCNIKVKVFGKILDCVVIVVILCGLKVNLGLYDLCFG